MKTLKNISYKLYTNGSQFLKENEGYLHKDRKKYIETAFFFSNAKNYSHPDTNNYAFQFKSDKEILLILKVQPYNMLLFGSKKLCEFAAKILADFNVSIDHILGENEITLEFLNQYQKKKGGSFLLEHSMQIMQLDQLLYFTNKEAFTCTEADLDALGECYCIFQKEIFNKELSLLEAKALIQGNEHNFYALKFNDKIVSIASRAREDSQVCAISHVFTLPEYRGKGYAKQVVSKLCRDILNEGKTPYLFVDSANPISNHLYLSLGFHYVIHQVQYNYK